PTRVRTSYGSPLHEISLPVLLDDRVHDGGLDQAPPGAARHTFRLSGHPGTARKEFLPAARLRRVRGCRESRKSKSLAGWTLPQQAQKRRSLGTPVRPLVVTKA